MVHEWIKANKWLIHFDKSNFMIMSSSRKTYNSQNLHLYVNGNEIKQVAQCTFLGVVVDHFIADDSNDHLSFPDWWTADNISIPRNSRI